MTAPLDTAQARALVRDVFEDALAAADMRDELKRENAVLHRRLCEHEAAMDEIKLACRSKLGNAVPTTDVHNFALAILEEARSVE